MGEACPLGARGWGLWLCHLKCMMFQVEAVHLVGDLYYFRYKASKISVFHRPGQSLMHLRYVEMERRRDKKVETCHESKFQLI